MKPVQIVGMLLLTSLLQWSTARAQAQAPYPNRPIRLLVPMAAGALGVLTMERDMAKTSRIGVKPDQTSGGRKV